MFKLYSSMPVYKYDPEAAWIVVAHYEVVYECSLCGTKQAVKSALAQGCGVPGWFRCTTCGAPSLPERRIKP